MLDVILNLEIVAVCCEHNIIRVIKCGDKTDGAYSTHWSKEGRDYLGDLVVDGKIILK
jgi:hypothetical protein